MKTNIAPRQVATNAGETQEFTIKANGKAFRALISTLYENKIQSIVREIWSNALDAHIAAGCADRPFSVTFPTMFNPTFIVRDYGVSLDHDQVMKLYTTVFESTKEDTNDATGKFGLGSKSPFAYTDTFSVVAIKDGVKRFYSAVIGKEGIPAIHFLGQEVTDEPTGLEVSFPIKNEDIRAFRNAAKRVSHGFDVKPHVIRSEEEDEFEGWPVLSVMTEGTDWKLLNGIIEGYRQQAYAKMGPVLYPINADAIEDLAAAERALLNSTIVIEFAMGELEMTPSREALSYGSDEPTVQSIRTKLSRIVKEMVSTFQSEYDAAATYWEACTMFRKHVRTNAPEPVREALRKHANWKGKPLVTEKKVLDRDLPGVEVCIMTGSRRSNAVYRFRRDSDPTIPMKDNTLFVIEEEGDQRAPSKIKHYYDSMANKPETIIWLRTRTPSRRYGPVGAIEKLQAFYDLIDGADIALVSEMPEAPRTYYGGGGTGERRRVQVRVWDGYDFDTRADVDYEDGGFYVPLERMEPQYPYGMESPRYMWKALVDAGVVPAGSTLYGAPKSLWKRFEGDQWVNIYDLAAEAFKKSKPKASLAKRALIMEVRGTSELRWLDDAVKLADLGDGVAREALEFYQRVCNYTVPEVEGFIKLAKAVGQGDVIEEWSKFDRTEIDYHVEALETYYPLLSTIRAGQRYGEKPVDKITEYVQMCDRIAEIDSQNVTTAAAA